MGLWGSGGPYQQQVLHLVLGFVASGGHVLKRKGKVSARAGSKP